jgi:hypothetical protein
MSDDLKHRDSPPDFGDDDNKDDDQMFKSATLPVTDDIPLSDDDDDDDENPFGESSEKTKTPLTIPSVTPINVLEPQPSTPVKQETQLFSNDSGINITERNTSITPPAHSFEIQPPPSKPIMSENTRITTHVKPTEKRSNEHNIEITVSDPTKVGEVCVYLEYNIQVFIYLFRVCHHI